MTSTLKWLGGGVAAVMLLGLAGLFSGEVAGAQSSPSGPPHRFAGTVSIDGAPADAGTSVTAIVNGAECGSATVIESTAGSTYAVDVPASCADDGDTVNFHVMGYAAAEHGTWSGGDRTDLDLTASSMPAEEPGMDECPEDDMGEGMGDEPSEPMEPSEPAEPMDDMGDGMDDMADDCPEDDMGEEPSEPSEPSEPMDDTTDDDGSMTNGDTGPPDTGTGFATTSSSLAALLGVTALALVLGGYTFARRRR